MVVTEDKFSIGNQRFPAVGKGKTVGTVPSCPAVGVGQAAVVEDVLKYASREQFTQFWGGFAREDKNLGGGHIAVDGE